MISQQIRILHKTKIFFLVNCCPSGKYVNLLYMYSILGRGSFCFNYWLNSAWHGGYQFVALLRWYEAQVSLTAAFSSSAFFGLLFLIFLLTILHIFYMFRSGEFTGQSRTPTPRSFNQLLVLLAVWAGAKSCWKMKSASLKSCSAEGTMKCSKISILLDNPHKAEVLSVGCASFSSTLFPSTQLSVNMLGYSTL